MKYKMIGLFTGCGGLEEGFLQSGKFEEIAAIEWLQPQVKTLVQRLKTKWKINDADERVMCFDIRREQELFYGWDDTEVYPTPELLPNGKKSRFRTGPYGKGKGLDYFVNKANGIDVILGGPPCQAYSLAGRVRDGEGMKNDYRNYLFEHYLNIVNRYKPKVFIFENVPGLLSAVPDGIPVTELIKCGFAGIGYDIIDDLKNFTRIDAFNYGVPQRRERIIIVGIRRGLSQEPQDLLRNFYSIILPKYKTKCKKTVLDAIGDLPALYPIDSPSSSGRIGYTKVDCHTTWHIARRHNSRDINIYRMLAEDIESGKNDYAHSKALCDIYEQQVGAKSPIHRYYVLKRDKPSTTIIAHLDRDGNRFIHYDSKQSRSITPREAARIQSFDDDFDFLGTQTDTYIMVGNAVPPVFAKSIALAVADLLKNLHKEEKA